MNLSLKTYVSKASSFANVAKALPIATFHTIKELASLNRLLRVITFTDKAVHKRLSEFAMNATLRQKGVGSTKLLWSMLRADKSDRVTKNDRYPSP